MDNYYDNNNFDIDKFNKRFKEIQDEEKNKNKLEREEYLKTLEEEDETKKVTDLTVKEIIINTKNEIFDLIYEIISFDFEARESQMFVDLVEIRMLEDHPIGKTCPT